MPLPTPLGGRRVSRRGLCTPRPAGTWQSRGGHGRAPPGAAGWGRPPGPHLGLGDLAAAPRAGAVYCKGNEDFPGLSAGKGAALASDEGRWGWEG